MRTLRLELEARGLAKAALNPDGALRFPRGTCRGGDFLTGRIFFPEDLEGKPVAISGA
jgi:hypothetical protein